MYPLFLTPELKKSIDDYVRYNIPKFAKEIIAKRRKNRRWLIQKAEPKAPTRATWPTKLTWCDHSCFFGDEYDVISYLAILRENIKPGYLDAFNKSIIEEFEGMI